MSSRPRLEAHLAQFSVTCALRQSAASMMWCQATFHRAGCSPAQSPWFRHKICVRISNLPPRRQNSLRASPCNRRSWYWLWSSRFAIAAAAASWQYLLATHRPLDNSKPSPSQRERAMAVPEVVIAVATTSKIKRTFDFIDISSSPKTYRGGVSGIPHAAEKITVSNHLIN